MPITTRKIAQFTKKIADLADKPNLGSSSALKSYFDSSPEELRVAINGLIDDLLAVTAGSSGASNIGVSPISGLTGSDVQKVIENLYSALKSVASSSSGAHLIGSSPIPEVAGSTVYAQLSSLKALIDLIFSRIIATTPGSSGAELVGSAPIPGVAGATVFAQLANIYAQLRDVVLNQIPDGTVTDSKLSNSAGQIKDRFAAHLAETATGIFNVQTGYDALGDGVSDNTSKLSSAVSSALAVSGELYFPHGTYLITANIPNWHDVKKSGPGKIKVGGQTLPIEPKQSDAFTLYIDGTSGAATGIGYGSGSLAFKTWAQAASALNNNPNLAGIVTIDVAAGTYSESVTFDRYHGTKTRLLIVGKKDGSNVPTVIFDGTSVGSVNGINLMGQYGSITDVKFQNFSRSGLYIESCPFLGVNNVHGFRCGTSGYETVRSSRSAVIYNGGIIDGDNVSTYGATAYNGFLSVLNVTIRKCNYGAYWAAASAGHCDGNTIEQCAYGVAARHGGFVSSFLNNTLNNNTSFAVYADFGGNVIVDYPTTIFNTNGENVKIIQSLGNKGKIWDDTTPGNRTVFEINGNNLDFVTEGAGAFLASITANGLKASSSAWNGAHFSIGAYHFWVDATGKLRMKASAPTTDLDGTVVGTQT